MTTVQDLFRRADRQTVLEFLLSRGYGRKNKWDCVFPYAAAFETVKSCVAEPNKDNMVVQVKFSGWGLCDRKPGRHYEDWECEVYHSIHGADDWTRGEGDGDTWGLQFNSLEAWAGYFVENSVVERMGVNKLTALILEEMTFYGFTSERIEANFAELNSELDEARSRCEDEVREKTHASTESEGSE